MRICEKTEEERSGALDELDTQYRDRDTIDDRIVKRRPLQVGRTQAWREVVVWVRSGRRAGRRPIDALSSLSSKEMDRDEEKEGRLADCSIDDTE
jgi:hypothetical protein